MNPSISSEFSVLGHSPRCLSFRQHRFYPLHEGMVPEKDMAMDMQQAGALSLHHYRKALYSDPDDCVVLDVRGRKKLRRKNGASNLHTPSASTTSSPPPLSPCYSTTISLASQRSEADYDLSTCFDMFCRVWALFGLTKQCRELLVLCLWSIHFPGGSPIDSYVFIFATSIMCVLCGCVLRIAEYLPRQTSQTTIRTSFPATQDC